MSRGLGPAVDRRTVSDPAADRRLDEAINVRMLTESLIETARDVAGDRWSQTRHLAELELRLLAQTAADIERLARDGRITPDRARLLFDIHRTSARSALMSAKELAAGGAEEVIRASVAVIAQAVGPAAGITLD